MSKIDIDTENINNAMEKLIEKKIKQHEKNSKNS